jgi:hypothetical protein
MLKLFRLDGKWRFEEWGEEGVSVLLAPIFKA